MFDAQKLLGMVLRDAMAGSLGGSQRRRGRRASLTGLPAGLEGKIGMGLVGLAIVAFEHFRQVPVAAGGAVPMPAMPSMSSMPSTPPPPPAGYPVPAIANVSDADQLHALHLLRAMIAAANADGVIDAAERAALGERARAAGLDDEEVQALDRELGTPLSIEQLVLQTPEDLREQVYIAALVAIEPDTDSEQRFHADLATGLRLDPATQVALRQQLGLA